MFRSIIVPKSFFLEDRICLYYIIASFHDANIFFDPLRRSRVLSPKGSHEVCYI